MDWTRMTGSYMDYCQSRQLRPKTMLSYEQTLTLFGLWLQETFGLTAVEAIQETHIRKYIIDLQNRGKYTVCSGNKKVNFPQNRRDYQRKISNITINNYLRNLNAFFNWLVEAECIRKSPMCRIKPLPQERRPREYLEDDEVKRLLKSLDRSYFPEYRDLLAIMIMLDCGTRLGETLSAEMEQLDLVDGCLTLPAEKTKGRKARTVYFSDRTARELRKWLQYKDRYCESNYLFPSRNSGDLLDTTCFEKNFRKYMKRLGISKTITPHTLRNNFAKRCLMAGMDIYTLSRILGHSSVKVTEMAYLDLQDADLKVRYGRYSPIGNLYR